MNEQVLTDYVKVLLDQRANLEIQVLTLSQKVKDLESTQHQAKQEGSDKGESTS